MRKLLSILCIFALIATTAAANATPNIFDTSPIVCVDDYTPIAFVIADVPAQNAPVYVSVIIFEMEQTEAFYSLFAPDNPDIGFIDTGNSEPSELNCVNIGFIDTGNIETSNISEPNCLNIGFIDIKSTSSTFEPNCLNIRFIDTGNIETSNTSEPNCLNIGFIDTGSTKVFVPNIGFTENTK